MAKNVTTYEGGFLSMDSVNSAGSGVVRDPSTSGINVGPVNTTQVTKTQADIDTPATALTGATTLTATSAAKQRLNATGSAFTVTLPAAAGASGVSFTFIKTDASANVATIKGSGAELIGGANTYTGLSGQYNYIKVWCDGTQWYWDAKG